jgi:methyl-accepting chemotaxis protein
MKNLTIGKRIVLGTGVLCLIITISSIFAVMRIISLNKISDSIVKDSLPGVIDAGVVNSLQAENQIRNCLLLVAKTPEQKQKLKAEIDANSQQIGAALTNYEATIFETEDRNNFDKLKAARAEYRKQREQYFSMLESNPAAASDFLVNNLVPAYDTYSKAADVILDYNSKHGRAQGDTLSTQVTTDIRILTIVGIVGLIAGIVGSLFIVTSIGKALRSIAAQIGDGANQTASASAQVSGSSQSLAEGASEQASSLEETSSSLEEMASMTKRNAENARKANDLAKEARTAADKGVGDMQAMSTAMDAIKVSSNDIAKIIKTIDEIAFQTNILALNAAVEAARAGEAGMGFAVVADEVRNLAQRSAAAAKETADKIEGAITKTGQGVEISSKVSAALNDIVTKVRQVDELVTEVASASREQTEGITQINTAVGQMDKVTQSNAANAEESAAAAEELNAQAGVMKESVNELLQLVGNTGRSDKIHPSSHTRQTKEFRSSTLAGQQPAPAHSNGNGHRIPAMTTDISREQIPLEGNFKDF